MKIKPKLPANPELLDRIEDAMQWWFYCVTVDLPGKPALSGLLTGVLVGLPFIVIIVLLNHFWR